MTIDPSASLNKKYIGAISIIVLLIIVSQIILQLTLLGKKEDGRYINIAGRQRMLSERIVKYVLATIETRNEKNFLKFFQRSENALKEWEIAQEALQYGNKNLGVSGANSDQIIKEFDSLNIHFNAIIKNVTEFHSSVIKTGPTDNKYDSLVNLSDVLISSQYLYVNQMEKIVKLYEFELSEKISKMQQLEILLFVFTLLIICLEVIFIFYPATKELSNQWKRLIDLNIQLKDEKEKAEFFILKSEQSATVKTDFLSKVSHEFRTPLNGILGMSNLLKMSELNSEQKEFTKIINDSGKKLLELVDDVLVYARVHQDEITKKNDVIDIPKLMFDLGLEFSNKYKNKDIDLNIVDESDMPDQLIGDKGKFTLIIKNILDNAYKFTDSGEITILLEYYILDETNSNVYIKINDSGIGISNANQKKIFEMFNQVDNSSTRAYEGLGNGLTLSKELVNYLNGRLVLESQEKIGTTVTIFLPFKSLEKYDE